MNSLNVFDVGSEVSCVVGFIHEQYSRHEISNEIARLDRIRRRHQHVRVHRAKKSTLDPVIEKLPFEDCEHHISSRLHSDIIGDQTPHFHAICKIVILATTLFIFSVSREK